MIQASRASILTYPLFMGAFMALSFACLRSELAPSVWIPALTILDFLVLLGLEQLFPRRSHMNTLRDRQSINDAGHGVLTALLRPFGAALGVLAIARLAEIRDTSGTSLLWPDTWNLVLQVVLAQLLVSFVAYWVHRSQHEIERIWWFHALHHDTGQVHVLKSGRFHFLDEMYSALLTPLPLLILGVPSEVVILRSMWQVFNGSMGHANVAQRFPSWFHYLISTVDVHNIHHAASRRLHDSNYSGLPIWDVIFGTFHHPDTVSYSELGISEDYVPRNFFAQLWFPFAAQMRPPEASVEPGDAARKPA